MTEQEPMDMAGNDAYDAEALGELSVDELATRLAVATEEASRNLEGWQRTQAEFANARKRMEKQRADAYLDANVDLVRKLLPVVDDMDRALRAAPDLVKGDSWFSGLALVARKFASVLESLQVEPIETVGQPFDPNWHEAIGQDMTDEYESGIVSREMQKGYRLGDQIIRPALVYVAA